MEQLPKDFIFKESCEYEKGVVEIIRNHVKSRRKLPEECECIHKPGQPRCGDDSCINRSSHIECDKNCANCLNQRIRKKEFSTCLRLAKYSGKGYGLCASSAIGCNTIVIEYAGYVTTTYPVDRDDYVAGFKSLQNVWVDARPIGNMGRFINHSHDPNLDLEEWSSDGLLRLVLVANKDIEAGSELTFDYNWVAASENSAKMECFCQASNCPKVMHKDPPANKARIFSKKDKGASEDEAVPLHQNSKSTPAIGVILADMFMPPSFSIQNCHNFNKGDLNQLKTNFDLEKMRRNGLNKKDLINECIVWERFLQKAIGCKEVKRVKSGNFASLLEIIRYVSNMPEKIILYLICVPQIYFDFKIYFDDVKSFKCLVEDILRPVFGNKKNCEQKVDINVLWSASLGSSIPNEGFLQKPLKYHLTPTPFGFASTHLSAVAMKLMEQLVTNCDLPRTCFLEASQKLIINCQKEFASTLSLTDDVLRPTVEIKGCLDSSSNSIKFPSVGVYVETETSVIFSSDAMFHAAKHFFDLMNAKIIRKKVYTPRDLETILGFARQQCDALLSEKVFVLLDSNGNKNGFFLNHETFCPFRLVEALLELHKRQSKTLKEFIIVSLHNKGDIVPSPVITKTIVQTRHDVGEMIRPKIVRDDVKINMIRLCAEGDQLGAVSSKRGKSSYASILTPIFSNMSRNDIKIDTFLSLYRRVWKFLKDENFLAHNFLNAENQTVKNEPSVILTKF